MDVLRLTPASARIQKPFMLPLKCLIFLNFKVYYNFKNNQTRRTSSEARIREGHGNWTPPKWTYADQGVEKPG